MVAIGPAFASPYSPLSLIPKNTRPDEAKLDKARKASNARRVHPQAASEGRARPPGARKTSSSTSFPLPPSLSPSPPPFVFWAIAIFFFPIEPFAQFLQNALISQLIIIKIRKKLSHLPALLSTICANPIILHNDTEECFEISSPHSYTSNKSSLLLLRLLFWGGRVDGQFFPVCLFPF